MADLLRGAVRIVKPIRRLDLDGLEIEIQTVQVPGAENTSSVRRSVEAAIDQVEMVMGAVGRRLGAAAQDLLAATTNPKEIALEFGLSIGTNGSVIVMGTTTEAAIKVTVTYDRESHRDNSGS